MEQNILGKNIAALRKAKDLTQEALARQLGVTFQAVSKWENGQSCPDIAMLPDLSDILGVSIDELFGRAPLVQAEALPPVEIQQAPAEWVIYRELPWDDDRSVLRVVLFMGHKLVGDTIFQRHQKEKQRVEFFYDGPALNIHSDFSVRCADSVIVQGNVDAGDDVTCGAVCGSVRAGDDVRCGAVGGNVQAGDSVFCEVVGGNVRASDSVNCGDVGGDVHAGDSVRCGAVQGRAFGPDGVYVNGKKQKND